MDNKKELTFKELIGKVWTYIVNHTYITMDGPTGTVDVRFVSGTRTITRYDE